MRKTLIAISPVAAVLMIIAMYKLYFYAITEWIGFAPSEGVYFSTILLVVVSIILYIVIIVAIVDEDSKKSEWEDA